MSNEEVSIRQCVTNGVWNSQEQKGDETDELVCSTGSVYPDHCKLVEDHLEVGKWPHKYFSGDKCYKRANQNWDVSNEQESLVLWLWVLACKNHWS
jgi:hypothetical protein